MKKVILLLSLLIITYSCKKDDNLEATHKVKIQLQYPNNNTKADVTIRLNNINTSYVYKAKTDKSGMAEFTIQNGVYNVSATDRRATNGISTVFNGLKNDINITDSWKDGETIKLDMTETKTSQIIIKELYFGGCPKNDGSGYYAMDKYVILYNNSNTIANLDNLALAITIPYNAHGSNRDYVGGKLSYEAQNWTPAGQAVWYFDKSISLEPGKQIVIALNNAVDNTVTYSNSINFANPNYYCTYDIENFAHPKYYGSPSEQIPTDHYLKAYKYGKGTGWALSVFSPAFFIFSTQDTTLKQFIEDAGTTNLYGGFASQVRKKVPAEWILDAVEVFKQGSDKNQKRIISTIDAGSINFTNKLGHTVYRNVDVDATNALPENTGKIIKNYKLGTKGKTDGGTTDPSNIDAEASIKNGARIIYMDSNNSGNDFHQRQRASLKS